MQVFVVVGVDIFLFFPILLRLFCIRSYTSAGLSVRPSDARLNTAIRRINRQCTSHNAVSSVFFFLVLLLWFAVGVGVPMTDTL